MRWIEITRSERDMLREEAKRQGGCFAGLQAMAEGSAPVGEERFTAVKLLALLNAIGWDLVGDDEIYRLPDTRGQSDNHEIIGLLVAVRGSTTDRHLAEVCTTILERPSTTDPLIDEALARAGMAG